MANNDLQQDQQQIINVDTITKKEEIACPFFDPPVTAMGEFARMKMDADPMAFRRVEVLTYRGNVTKNFCLYWSSGSCTSSLCRKEDKLCHIGPSKTS